MLRVAFIGCGRVGTTLALTLSSVGHKVLCGLARNPESASSRQFAEATGTPVFLFTSDEAVRALKTADFIFITTPDKAVTPVAQTLAQLGILHVGQIVAHTSGALGSDALSPCKAEGALTMSMHPLQTIATPTAGRAILENIYCTLEGHPLAVEQGTRLVEGFGGIPIPIDASLRPRYHAAAVLASNAIIALASVATELSGLPDGLGALLPLMKGALRNLESLGLPAALTGPIERGDVTTVQMHMNALECNPTAKSVYAALGSATADLAYAKGTLSRETLQTFITLFKEGCEHQSHLGGMLNEVCNRQDTVEDEGVKTADRDDDRV